MTALGWGLVASTAVLAARLELGQSTEILGSTKQCQYMMTDKDFDKGRGRLCKACVSALSGGSALQDLSVVQRVLKCYDSSCQVCG